MDLSASKSEINFSTLENCIQTLSGILEQQIKLIYGQKTLNLFTLFSSKSSPADFEQENLAKTKILKDLSISEIKKLTHCFTVFFLLSNQAEQVEIIKIKRLRQLAENASAPRAESVCEAILELKKMGLSAEQVQNLCNDINLTPTITAHPTESRRRSVLKKQLKVADCLFNLNKEKYSEFQYESQFQELQSLVASLLLTDDVRATRLSVEDEVENGLFFLAGSVVEIVPTLINDFRQAFKSYYQKELTSANPINYRSWIGGDRDGNPKVTCEVTTHALMLHRQQALTYYIRQIKLLRDELSLSSRKIEIPESVSESCRQDKIALGMEIDSLIDQHQVYEPFREKCETIKLKLQAALERDFAYIEKDFFEDLQLIKNCLESLNLKNLVSTGMLNKLLDQLQAFGFHLAKLDLRQHSDVHQASLNEIFGNNNIEKNYSALAEQEKIKLLSDLLDRDIQLSLADLSPQAAETCELFKLISKLEERSNKGLGSYVISMTHTVSDMLEVLVLWKIATETNLFPLDISPLFETIEDLENCGGLLSQILQDKQYKKHLSTRNNFQEVMLGYSDSNKDGGYASANILLYEAQLQIAKTCLANAVDFQIFHGRGGSVGRGGGRAGRAITASPVESNNGKVRITEQGEVISFRYSMPELGHRHLEQILSAVMLSTQMKQQSLTVEELDTLKVLAKFSMKKYRALVDDPAFWEWYVRITPIKFISSLPIASRPVMRSGANLEFENLRAIPWVFSWTQTRYNIPSWFGLGTAFSQLIQNETLSIEALQDFYAQRTFFKTLIDNAQQEMARARLDIAKLYLQSSDLALHELIEQEFNLTKKFILQITQQKELLDNNPVIQKSIARRNPYTDPLSLIQVELLSRDRQKLDQEDLTEAIHMTISGLAAAMQTTG